MMDPRKRGRRWRRWAVLGGGVLAVALVTADHSRGATGPAIGIKDFTYSPLTLTVPAGTTVTWVNHDEETHTVTSATSAFTSAGLGNDEAFAQTFVRPGVYAYFCALHPHMRATVVVK